MNESIERGVRLATLLVVGACGSTRSAVDASSGQTGAPVSGTETAVPTTTVNDTPATTDTSTSGADVDSSGSSAPIFDVTAEGGDPPPTGGIPATCDEAADAPTTVGCEFYATKLYTSSAQGPYGLVVANVQDDTTASVSFEVRTAAGWETYPESPVDIDPLDLYIFNGTQVGEWVFRIRSDVPVTAYQFRPLDGSNDYESTDASMLYPVTTWGDVNVGLMWAQGPSAGGKLTLVAAEDETEVELVVPIDLTVSKVNGETNLYYFTAFAGEVTYETLDDGQQLHINGPYDLASGWGTDISGTRVESSAPVAMFTHHPCAYVPFNVPACDHLEEQMAGLHMWGNVYVAARLPVRESEVAGASAPEDEIWHILASEDDTTLTFEAEPGVVGVPPDAVTLDAGERLELNVGGTFERPGDFTVRADKPIQVFTYMLGACAMPSNADCDVDPDDTQLGDPAQVQMSPVEQHLARYVVLVPPTWENDFLVLSRVAGTAITIDDVAIPDALFVPVADEHEVARVRVEDGIRRLEGDQPFGVVVAGYDWFDSYAYLGGQNALTLNPEG